MPASASVAAAAVPSSVLASAFWAGDSSARARRLSQLLAPQLAPPSSSASSGSCSSSSGGSLLRHYIDPWDLENYAYLRRRDTGCCSSTPALESSQSDFSYVAGSLEMPPCGPPAFAAVDEEPFCNAARPLRKTMRRASLPAHASAPPFAMYGNGGGGHEGSMDEDSGGDGSCRLYSPSLLVRRPPGDLVYVYGGRKLALPDVMGLADTCCYSGSDGASSADDDDEHRCCYFAPPPPAPPPPRFALSRHGHLRLDYSCSWASLDRYIAAE